LWRSAGLTLQLVARDRSSGLALPA